MWDCVLAWDLGTDWASRKSPPCSDGKSKSDGRPSSSGRPLICQADSQHMTYSRSVDFLVHGRQPLGTSLDLSDYAAWLRERPRLAQSGTPFWTTVQTQPAIFLAQQWQAFGLRSRRWPFPSNRRNCWRWRRWPPDRGLLFLSDTPLSDLPGSANPRLAMELLNLRLGFVEPGAAAGACNRPSPAASLERSPCREWSPREREHARLLVPLWLPPASRRRPCGGDRRRALPGAGRVRNESRLRNQCRGPAHAPHRSQAGRAIDSVTRSPRLPFLVVHQPEVVERFRQRLDRTVHDDRVGARPARRRIRTPRRSSDNCPAGRPPCKPVRGSTPPSGTWCRPTRWPRCAISYKRVSASTSRCVRCGAWSGPSGRRPRPRCDCRSPARPPCAGGAAVALAIPRTPSRGRCWRIRCPAAISSSDSMILSGWQRFQHETPGLEAAAELVPRAAHGGRCGLCLTLRRSPKCYAG